MLYNLQHLCRQIVQSPFLYPFRDGVVRLCERADNGTYGVCITSIADGSTHSILKTGGLQKQMDGQGNAPLAGFIEYALLGHPFAIVFPVG